MRLKRGWVLSLHTTSQFRLCFQASCQKLPRNKKCSSFSPPFKYIVKMYKSQHFYITHCAQECVSSCQKSVGISYMTIHVEKTFVYLNKIYQPVELSNVVMKYSRPFKIVEVSTMIGITWAVCSGSCIVTLQQTHFWHIAGYWHRLLLLLNCDSWYIATKAVLRVLYG